MTPIDALRSATTMPAKFLGLNDSLGTITVGKFADLILLDANPLDNIANTTRINAVIANGKIYDRSFIASVLERTSNSK
jgi:imidazolonepropionase-like amidohydrolase